MYFTASPTYPFGYGLSYTTFKYSEPLGHAHSTSPDGTVNVSFDVTNTGNAPGATVAQLYVSPPPPRASRPRSSSSRAFSGLTCWGPDRPSTSR